MTYVFLFVFCFLFYVFGGKILNARPDAGSGVKPGMRRRERTDSPERALNVCLMVFVISTFYRASDPALASDSTIADVAQFAKTIFLGS